MTNPNDYAFPVIDTINVQTYHGLTKREHFAAAALNGAIQLSIEALKSGIYETSPEKTAKIALEYADSLIAELAKEK